MNIKLAILFLISILNYSVGNCTDYIKIIFEDEVTRYLNYDYYYTPSEYMEFAKNKEKKLLFKEINTNNKYRICKIIELNNEKIETISFTIDTFNEQYLKIIDKIINTNFTNTDFGIERYSEKMCIIYNFAEYKIILSLDLKLNELDIYSRNINIHICKNEDNIVGKIITYIEFIDAMKNIYYNYSKIINVVYTMNRNILEINIENKVLMDFIYLKGGTTEIHVNKNNYIITDVNDMWISKTEITTELWNLIMGIEISNIDNNKPITNVSYNNIAGRYGFLNKINNNKNKIIFRLPTEREWVYAYRYPDNYLNNNFFWREIDLFEKLDSTTENEIKKYIYFNLNSDSRYWTPPHSDISGVQNISTKLPNKCSLYDMSGNVWEFTDPYIQNINQMNLNKDHIFVYGGSWRCPIENCQVYSRKSINKSYKYDDVGFRLVIDSSSLNPDSISPIPR